MQKNKLSDIHFAATTGYGYNDLGRDTLEAVYADVSALCETMSAAVLQSALYCVLTNKPPLHTYTPHTNRQQFLYSQAPA